jgi:hypothetical protein
MWLGATTMPYRRATARATPDSVELPVFLVLMYLNEQFLFLFVVFFGLKCWCQH